MACNSCGGSTSAIQTKRSSSSNGPLVIRKKMKLSPRTSSKSIHTKPANDLDKYRA